MTLIQLLYAIKEMELEGRPVKVDTVKRNVLIEDADATDSQIRFRNLVLYGQAD